jgi:hypothetical protein
MTDQMINTSLGIFMRIKSKIYVFKASLSAENQRINVPKLTTTPCHTPPPSNEKNSRKLWEFFSKSQEEK